MVLFALSLMAIIAFMALAIDLGMLAMARTQCRTSAMRPRWPVAAPLNGNTANGANNNYSDVAPTATAAATANPVMGTTLRPASSTCNIGRWAYSTSTQQFQGQFPGPSNQNWSLVQATVYGQRRQSVAFAKVFNFTGGNIQTDQHRRPSAARHRDRARLFRLDAVSPACWASTTQPPPARATIRTPSIPAWGHYSDVGAAALQASDVHLPYKRPTSPPPPATAGRRSCRIFTSTPAARRLRSASSSYAHHAGGRPVLKVSKNTGSTYAPAPPTC